MVGRFALAFGSLGLVALMATMAAAQTVSTPTVWSWLGIPAGLHKVRDSLTNRHGRFPGLERRPKLLRIADPQLAKIDNPAIKKAQQIKAEEDLAPQKIKAVKYLAGLGCDGCYKGVDEALLEAAKDCTESVRLATVKAIGGTRNKKCPHCDNNCCSEKIVEQLAKIAYERDEEHPDCWYEPSQRVRKAAQAALKVCCPGGTPPRLLRVEDDPIPQMREPETREPEPREPSGPEPESRPNTTTKTKPSPAVELVTVLRTAKVADPLAKLSDPDRPVALRRSDGSTDDPSPIPSLDNSSASAGKRPVTGLVWKTTSRGTSLRQAAEKKLPAVAEVARLWPGKPISGEIGYGKFSSAARLTASNVSTDNIASSRQSAGEKSVVVRPASAGEPIAAKRPLPLQSDRTSNGVCAKCGQKHDSRSAAKRSKPRSLYEVFFAPREQQSESPRR